MRRAYRDQFRIALARPALPDETELDLDAAAVAIAALASPDPRRARAAIELLADHGQARLIPALILHHNDPDVLIAGLGAIASAHRSDWQPLARTLCGHPVSAVRVAAVRALARAGHRDASISAGARDPQLRGHAAFWAAFSERAPGQHPNVIAILEGSGAAATAARVALLDAIAGDGDPRWADVVVAILALGEDETAAHAAGAIERAPDPRALPLLIARLGNRHGRRTVRAALLRLGAPALDALARALGEPTTPPGVAAHLPTTIALFPGELPVAVLAAQLGRRGAVGYRVLRALARIAGRAPRSVPRGRALAELRRNLQEHLRMVSVGHELAAAPPSPLGELLRGVVADKRGQARERAMMLLSIVAPREDVDAIADALAGEDRIARSHAHELLDLITRSARWRGRDGEAARTLLLLLSDDLDDAERLRRAEPVLGAHPTDVVGALAVLVADDDPAVAALAHEYGAELPAPAWPRAAAVIAPLPAALGRRHHG
jgi:hypothetical protein